MKGNLLFYQVDKIRSVNATTGGSGRIETNLSAHHEELGEEWGWWGAYETSRGTIWSR